MNFTKNSTTKEILSDNWLIPCKGFIPEEYLDALGSEIPLEKWCERGVTKTYMESVVAALNILRERYEKDPNLFIPIWDDMTDIEKKEVEDIVLMPFLIDKESPCYIVCAGGGYVRNVLPDEGVQTAMEFNRLGVNAVILTYRVAPYQFPKPQQDLIRAIQFVRANKERFHMKDNKVVIMGYSAAGHLCGSVGALYDQIDMPKSNKSDISKRPDAIILSYPVVSFISDPHVGSANNLLGEYADQEKRSSLSVEHLITNNYPPTFIWHCEADESVLPSNSILLDKVLSKHEIPHEFHLYPGGSHGCGLAIGTEAEKWISSVVSFVEKNI